MFLQASIAVLVILQGSLVSTSTFSCNLSNKIVKEVNMTLRDQTEFMIYNICDSLKLKLPSGLAMCDHYTWILLPNRTYANQATLPGIASERKINLDNPSKFGVYCTQPCNSNNEYCAAITVSPSFVPEEMPNCMILNGKSAQITCTSIGFPIVSRIVDSKDIDVCPPVDSTANITLVGQAAFGKLYHTCDFSLPDFGVHEFVCKVEFLPWDSNLNSSFTIATSLYCNTTAADGKVSATSTKASPGKNGSSESSGGSSNSVVWVSSVTVSVVVLAIIAILVFAIILLIWVLKRQHQNKPAGEVETDGDTDSCQESMEINHANDDVNGTPENTEKDAVSIRQRRK